MKTALAILTAMAINLAHTACAGILAGPVTNSENGHTYYLLTSNTWAASEIEARSLGGHLATINDLAENNWVFDRFERYGGVPRNLWIGYTDAGQEGTWTWPSGEAPGFTYWHSVEPDNWAGIQNYAFIMSSNYVAPDPQSYPTEPRRWGDVEDLTFNGGLPMHGVVEVALQLHIRESQVELCWETTSNWVYQLQYRSSLTTNIWLPLGGAVVGNGGWFCTNDVVLAAEPRRFYQLTVTNAP